MQVLRQATIDLLDAVLAERLPTSIPELLRLALERHHASLRAERKAADADRKQAKAASKAEEEAQRRDKAAKEQSVKEARKAAEAAEAALEKAKASAEAKARSEEKAAREAEAAAFEASEAKLRADEANATAEAAAEEADREARQEVQSDEQKRITAEEALRHPYLAQFHNPADEPLCDHRILIPVDDNIKYSVQEYREKLYSEIVQRKKVCHRIPSLPLFSHRFRFRSCVEECASVSRLGQCNKDPVTYSRV